MRPPKQDARVQVILTVQTVTSVLPIGTETDATNFLGRVTTAAVGAELALLASCSALAAKISRARRAIGARLDSLVPLAANFAMLS